MSQLRIPKTENYDDFRYQTEQNFSDYLLVAAKAIASLTSDDLSAQAMVHPDGFLKLQIGPTNGVVEGQVRLHFSIPGRTSTEQPHSHPWHLASFVLAGTYQEYQPKMIPVDQGLKKWKVLYPSGDDIRAGVERVGQHTYLSEKGSMITTVTGEAHYLPAEPLHMSSPDGSGGITLASMSPRFQDEALFYAIDDTPYLERVTSEDIDAVMGMIHSLKGDI